MTNGPFLTKKPIPGDIVEEVSAEFRADISVGAVVSFSGVVRADKTEAGTVSAIEFSAHEEMAEGSIHRLLERLLAREEFADAHVYVRHAVGTVPVGGIPIVIVVGAGHRREAFALCSEVLEALKAEVPIYGKELTADGGYVWKTNT